MKAYVKGLCVLFCLLSVGVSFARPMPPEQFQFLGKTFALRNRDGSHYVYDNGRSSTIQVDKKGDYNVEGTVRRFMDDCISKSVFGRSRHHTCRVSHRGAPDYISLVSFSDYEMTVFVFSLDAIYRYDTSAEGDVNEELLLEVIRKLMQLDTRSFW